MSLGNIQIRHYFDIPFLTNIAYGIGEKITDSCRFRCWNYLYHIVQLILNLFAKKLAANICKSARKCIICNEVHVNKSKQTVFSLFPSLQCRVFYCQHSCQQELISILKSCIPFKRGNLEDLRIDQILCIEWLTVHSRKLK